MKPTTAPTTLAALLAAAGAAACLAQPVLIVTPAAEDIDASGTKTVGRLLELIPGPDFNYVPYVWQRGVGFTRIPGVSSRPTMVRGSSDLSALVCDLPNAADWGALNCFAGYCFGSMVGCTPGDPLPPNDPCSIPVLAHHWTAGTGWINGGSLPRFQDSATGRFFGGTRCDGNINYPSDISGDGRYIVGGAWSARLNANSGGPGFGLCGDFFAFRYDSWTGDFAALPTASRTTNAYHVNHDGSVVIGYDLGPIPDGQGGFYDGRRQVVWTDNVETILDPITDNSSVFALNGAGTTIAGFPGPEFNRQHFGSGGLKLVRWVRQNDNSWTPQNLGRPSDRDQGLAIDILVALYPQAVSDDGSTIIGTAQYNQLGPGGLSRLFIWRPSINGGVPMDLQDYIASIAPGSPLAAEGLMLSFSRGISSDGNAVAVQVFDARNTCTNGATSLFTGASGVLYLNGAGVPCEPPSIAIQPADWDERQYTPFGVAVNVFAAGTFPMNYQWQREDPANPGTWIDLSDDCADFNRDVDWNFEGTHTVQLRIGQGNCGLGRDGLYRVAITNACGSIVSDPARITFHQCGLCPADFNADDFVDFFDYDDYVNCFENGACPPGKTADFNNDGFADFFDYDDFVSAFEAGC